MPIPEQQLDTWSNQGATASAQATHISVRTALAANTSPIREMNYEVYLQGSYRNDTNVRADSDVDIVVQYNSIFGYNILTLPAIQAQLFNAEHSNAIYLWEHFRTHVLVALRAYYGYGSVEETDRCLKVAAAPGRVPGDVVPAIPFRNYNYFYAANGQSYVEGIRFEDRNGRVIVNYPRQHYDNGVAKNSLGRTLGRFKRTVRMFKNARTRATERGFLAEGVASSYFIDCLIWNAPDSLFSASFQDTYRDIGNHLHAATLSGYFCRNGIIPLFGASPEQWAETKARQLITALARLWNEW
jgi:predicted nucleotidyltransferase